MEHRCSCLTLNHLRFRISCSIIEAGAGGRATSTNMLTESECRVNKLRLSNLVANLDGEPSPDDYDKDICELIGYETAPPTPSIQKFHRHQRKLTVPHRRFSSIIALEMELFNWMWAMWVESADRAKDPKTYSTSDRPMWRSRWEASPSFLSPPPDCVHAKRPRKQWYVPWKYNWITDSVDS